MTPEMLLRPHTHIRGWAVTWDGQDWHYDDNGELCHEQRPCPKCGRKPTAEGHDACLGHIPGVRYACCGHGLTPLYLSWHWWALPLRVWYWLRRGRA